MVCARLVSIELAWFKVIKFLNFNSASSSFGNLNNTWLCEKEQKNNSSLLCMFASRIMFIRCNLVLSDRYCSPSKHLLSFFWDCLYLNPSFILTTRVTKEIFGYTGGGIYKVILLWRIGWGLAGQDNQYFLNLAWNRNNKQIRCQWYSLCNV